MIYHLRSKGFFVVNLSLTHKYISVTYILFLSYTLECSTHLLYTYRVCIYIEQSGYLVLSSLFMLPNFEKFNKYNVYNLCTYNIL